MANETLISKLRKASSNNELPTLTDFRFNVDAYSPFSTSNYIVVSSTDSTDTLEMPNGEFLNYQGVPIGSSVTVNSGNIYPSNGGGVILLHKKQDVRILNFRGNTGKNISLGTLKYIIYLNKLILDYGSGDIKDIQFAHMTDLTLTGNGFYGSLGDMNCPNLKNLFMADAVLSGGITALSKFQSIENVTLGRISGLVDSIENLVNGFRTRSTNPLSSGSLICNIIDCPNITFNGSACTHSSPNTQLSWTATTITYNGVTITA